MEMWSAESTAEYKVFLRVFFTETARMRQ